MCFDGPRRTVGGQVRPSGSRDEPRCGPAGRIGFRPCRLPQRRRAHHRRRIRLVRGGWGASRVDEAALALRRRDGVNCDRSAGPEVGHDVVEVDVRHRALKRRGVIGVVTTTLVVADDDSRSSSSAFAAAKFDDGFRIESGGAERGALRPPLLRPWPFVDELPERRRKLPPRPAPKECGGVTVLTEDDGCPEWT